MKIESSLNTVDFEDVAVGDYFRYCGAVYQKLGDNESGVDVSNGLLTDFDYDDKVVLANCKLVDEDETKNASNIVYFHQLQVGETFKYYCEKGSDNKFKDNIFVKADNVIHDKHSYCEYNAFNLMNNNIFTIDKSAKFVRVNAKVVVE